MKKTVFIIMITILINLFGNNSYALSSPNVDSVEILSENTIKMFIGDTITLEATAIPNGVDFTYMTWITDVDGIVEINGEYDKKLLPPVGTVDITALNAGVVQVIVCANLEAFSPEAGIDEWSDATDRITITVCENNTFPQKYEIWNNDKYTEVSLLKSYVGNLKPILYINIKDISKLGLNVEDTEGGIIISNDAKKAKVMFDAEVLNLDSYSFETPVISTSKDHFLKLDIIGKCFSEGYSGERVDDVWRIYLTVDSDSDNNKPSISLQSTTFNFNYNVYTIQLNNASYNEAEVVNIYTAYYSKDDTLLDFKSSMVYNLKAKDELITFMPISDFFNSSAKCKIMLWNDKMQPIGETVTIKDFIYNKNITVPENKEIIFNDIPSDHKYYEVIYIMHNQNLEVGMFNGYEDGTYRPDGYILKSEVAYSLFSMLGMKVRNMNIDCNLKDVPSSHWCKTAIGFLVSNNIMDVENEYFYPNSEITLNEVLTVFLRILGEKNITTDTIMMLANQHNLLTNVNIEELEITRGNYTQIAYNFMNEYCE